MWHLGYTQNMCKVLFEKHGGRQHLQHLGLDEMMTVLEVQKMD